MAGIRNRAQKLAAAGGAEVGHLQYLIRAILAMTEPGQKPFGADPQPVTENILVDIDLDGIRYLLIQMPVPDHGHNALSPRELEIARMVAQGHQNKIIANILNISTWTVCAHVRRIFAKLSVSSRAAMVARLLDNDRPLKSPPALAAGATAQGALPAGSASVVPRLHKQDRETFARPPGERRIGPRNSLLLETAKHGAAGDRGAPRSCK
jgi:DNA-binding CsgD family transcriptional regulator